MPRIQLKLKQNKLSYPRDIMSLNKSQATQGKNNKPSERAHAFSPMVLFIFRFMRFHLDNRKR